MTAINHSATIADRPAAGPHGTGSGDAAVILLVDDEAGIRTLVRRVLERNGYRVHTAEDGVAGLDLARRLPHIDILVTDVVMPRMYGTELAVRICREKPALPVLFISGYTTDERIRGGRLDPGQAFLEKPFTPDVFVEAVHKLLEPGSHPIHDS